MDRDLAPARASSVISVLVAAFALALVSCSTNGSKHAGAAPADAATPKPKLATVTVRSIEPQVALAGIIAPYQNVGLASTLSEPADTVNVQEGDHVFAGQVLARLNTADLEANLAAAQATISSMQANTSHSVYAGRLAISQGVNTYSSANTAVAQAKQNLLRDQRDLVRYQSLFQNGYISAQQLQTQQTTVRNDEQAVRAADDAAASARATVSNNGTLDKNGLQATTLQQAQAQVAVAQAQAAQLRVQISKAAIISPIDGVVVNRNLNPGEYPGTRQIFTLQQVEPVYAILHGSGMQIAQIHVGNSGTVTASDLGSASYTGQVIGVLNQVTPGSTDFQVKILLHNPKQLLRPGMPISGKVALQAVSGPAIPLSSFTDVAHDAVIQVDNSGKTTNRTVVSRAENGKFAIVSGIDAGARVMKNAGSTGGSAQ